MYISYNWLKDFIKISPKISPNEIADKLTAHTVEVEGWEDQSDKFNKVVVGKVLEVKKHPNADRLRLVLVDVRDKKLNIVCGAPNVADGQLVAVALVGAILPGGLEIKASEIRGEMSEGMICAEDELGLGKDHDGIMVLGKKAKIGEPFVNYLKLNDIIFEVDNKSLSNRPDLLSHYGLARELGVIFDANLKPYEKIIGEKIELVNSKNNKLDVVIENKEACPRYMAIKIDNIKIVESPDWLKERLVAINQRPINNIVDITNYVMFDCGQPMHAFDAANVKKIVVRLAKQESMETLDGKERKLENSDLVITDGRQSIAIAGVMGGKNSEVSVNTTSIILESANFKDAIIRKTSQKLGLRTEASTRFEKSLDLNLTEDALFRFISILKTVCPDIKIASDLFDSGEKESEAKKINLSYDWLFAKIGQEIPRDQVVNILTRLGFKLTKHKDQLEVTIPSWRATKDVNGQEDLAEEILRIYGYDNIVSALPIEKLIAPEINQERMLERKMKDVLALRFNLNEVSNYSFVGEEQLKKLNIDFFNHLKLANPLSEIHSMLRQSLIPGLVSNIKNNQFKDDELGFFELGGVFFNAPGDFKKDNDSELTLPYQEKRLSIAIASNSKDIFLQIKSIASNFLRAFIGQEEVSYSSFENIPGWSNKKLTATISIFGKEIGIIGVLNEDAKNKTNIKMTTGLVEININILSKIILSLPSLRFQEAAKYPPVIRDLAFVVSEEILYNDFKREMLNFNPIIKSVELFDIYTGDKLSSGEKSLALHLYYQSEEKTLTSIEVDAIQTGLIDYMASRFEAKLRNF